MPDPPEREPVLDRGLDRDAVLFAAGVWAAELLQHVLRALSNDTLGGPKEIFEKVLYNLIAFGLTSAIWGFLRTRGPFTAWSFIRAAAPLIFVASAVNTLLSWGLYYIVTPEAREPFSSFGFWVRAAPQPLSYLWVFVTWSCFVATLVGSAQVRARERALAESESQVQEARLRALRYQVHPHLVFNSLNAVVALMDTGRPAKARRMLELLSSFLRNSLEASSESLVPLGRELESQQMYLDIETVRFSDRLTVKVAVDADAREALVPALILQPLVENAIKHGLGRSLEGAVIQIGAQREGDRLQLWVEDNAVPATSASSSGLGIGLENIRSRLATQYGKDAVLMAGPVAQGWRSEINLPFDVEVHRLGAKARAGS